LWGASEAFYTEVSGVLSTAGIAVQKPREKAPAATEIPALFANVFRISRLSLDTLLEFYHVSPAAVMRLRQSGSRLQPVPVTSVSVQLPVATGILEYVRKSLPEYKARLGPFANAPTGAP
jgi:hypothetical protein